jgi:GntR family transcriptional regulator/MocR family aminotransferase
MRQERSLEIPLSLDRARAMSLQAQLCQQLRQAMVRGALAPGARLPASRSLARSLGVSRNVVVAAYDELFAEGYITGRHGSGTYVEQLVPSAARSAVAG